MLGHETDAAGAMCSRAHCGEPAVWRIDWRNPRIHEEGRVKSWLACDEHVEYLREFLAARDFPLSVAQLAGAHGGSALPFPDRDGMDRT